MTPSQIRLLKSYKRLLLCLDIIGLTLILLVAYSLRFNSSYELALKQPLLWGILLVNILTLYIFGAYDIGADISIFERFIRIVAAGLVGFGFFVALIYLTRTDISGLVGRGIFLPSFFIFITYGFLLRLGIGWYLQYLREFRWKWFAFGDMKVLERLSQDARKNSVLGQLETLVVEENDDLALMVSKLRQPWEGVIMATKMPLPDEISSTLLHLRLNGLQVASLTQVYEHFWGKLPVHFLENHWLITAEGFSITHNPVGLRIKRLMDIGLSLLLLVMTWPLFLLTMIAIKVDSAGPVFFTQTRTGKDGKDFSIIKFRSMTTDAEKNGAQWAQKNDVRVTRVGRIIRLTRIDELPQIFNVLMGDMSFIGPRPERPEFNEILERQIPYYQLRHLLRPGITGWAQVMYPYGASVEDAVEKLQYELYYIKNYTVGLDMLIVLKTIKIVLFGRGR